jgi:hypothetical protein
VIALPGFVNATLARSSLRTRVESLAQIQDLWSEVVRQVLAQGLFLGLSFSLPARRVVHTPERIAAGAEALQQHFVRVEGRTGREEGGPCGWSSPSPA